MKGDGAMPETEVAPEEVVVTDETLPPEDESTPEPEIAAESDDLGDGGKQAIVAEREARKVAERKLKTVEKQYHEVSAALKAYEDRDKTEVELLREKAETAERRAAEAEQERLRQKIASEKGVLAELLTGATEDEITSSADRLIEWLQSKAPAPRPRPTEGLKSGASGVDNPTPDLKVRAAEGLRRLRSGL